MWIHGDLGTGNLLAVDGRLNAVIDFGTPAVGDPACDLIPAWMFLPSEARSAFRAALESMNTMSRDTNAAAASERPINYGDRP